MVKLGTLIEGYEILGKIISKGASEDFIEEVSQVGPCRMSRSLLGREAGTFYTENSVTRIGK